MPVKMRRKKMISFFIVPKNAFGHCSHMALKDKTLHRAVSASCGIYEGNQNMQVGVHHE